MKAGNKYKYKSTAMTAIFQPKIVKKSTGHPQLG